MLFFGGILDNAKTIAEEIADGEILRHFEGVVILLQTDNTVEGIRVEGVIFGVPGQHIPATLEDLNSVGLHVFVQLLFIGIKFLIFHVEGAAVVHQIDDVDERVLTCRDVFEADAVFQAFALADDIVEIEGVDEPTQNEVLIFQFFSIIYVIAIGFAVAANLDVEGVLDFFFVLLECSLRVTLAFRQEVVALPLFVDFIEGYAYFTSTIDGIEQPDVAFDFIDYHG